MICFNVCMYVKSPPPGLCVLLVNGVVPDVWCYVLGS